MELEVGGDPEYTETGPWDSGRTIRASSSNSLLRAHVLVGGTLAPTTPQMTPHTFVYGGILTTLVSSQWASCIRVTPYRPDL